MALTSDLCGAFDTTTNPTGGNPPYHFTLESGVGFPPFGIMLNLNGLLAGTPTTEGTSTFGVCAVDQVGTQTCRTTSLEVVGEDPNIPRGSYSGDLEADGFGLCLPVKEDWDADLFTEAGRLKGTWRSTFFGESVRFPLDRPLDATTDPTVTIVEWDFTVLGESVDVHVEFRRGVILEQGERSYFEAGCSFESGRYRGPIRGSRVGP